MQRLRRLSECLVLRRGKRTIKLLNRHDFKCSVEINEVEEKLFSSELRKAITKLDDYIGDETTSAVTGIHVNMLQ